MDKSKFVKIDTINKKWLAKGSIQSKAASFLQYLKTTDKERLDKTVNIVVGCLDGMWEQGFEDPKAIFYASLFSSIKDSLEWRKFLKGHTFTEEVLKEHLNFVEDPKLFDNVGYDTQKKISDTREYVMLKRLEILRNENKDKNIENNEFSI